MKRALRPYQREATAAMDAALASGRKNTVLSLCPSGGKTFTTIHWLDDHYLSKGKRVAWIVHRDELSQNAADDFNDHATGTKVSMWYGSIKDSSGQVVIISNQSFQSWLNMVEKHPEEATFDIVVIDECHHATRESTYDRIVSTLKYPVVVLTGELTSPFLLGLSGTPRAVDGKLSLFDHIAYTYTFTRAYTEGYCARPIYKRCRTKQAHLFEVRAGEFTKRSLKALNNAPRNEYVAEMFWDHRTPDGCKCKGAKCQKSWWPGVFYCVDVDHVFELRKALVAEGKRRGIQARFEVITGETETDKRRQTIKDFRNEKVDGLVNCEVFTEGTDLPVIRSIQLCRPTASERLWIQIALRGGRSFPEFVVTGDEDPSKGLHPDNHYYMVDYVDSVQFAENLSRQMAIKFLDGEQVRKEVNATNDFAKQKEAVEAAGMQAEVKKIVDGLFGPQADGSTVDEKWKKRFVEYEESGLEMEEFVLAGIASVLIFSTRSLKDERLLLTEDEDVAVLLCREYIDRRLDKDTKPDEKLAAIKKTHELFGKKVMPFSRWKNIAEAYFQYSVWKQAFAQNGGRTWLYISGLTAPPEQEVMAAIDELEAIYDESNSKFDPKVLWAQILEVASKRWPSPMWNAIQDRCTEVTWTDRVFGFVVPVVSSNKQIYWAEAAVEVILRELTGYQDATATVRPLNDSKMTCPNCTKKLVMRSSARGRFLGCSGYPKCDFTQQWMSKKTAFDDMRFTLGQKMIYPT